MALRDVDYRRITPQEIAFLSASFKQTLIAWLADAQNGIENLFAKNLYAENIEAKRGTFDELCVGTVCATNPNSWRSSATPPPPRPQYP